MLLSGYVEWELNIGYWCLLVCIFVGLEVRLLYVIRWGNEEEVLEFKRIYF